MHTWLARSRVAALLPLLLALGCLRCAEPESEPGPTPPGDTDQTACPRLPAPADRARKVLISHPNDIGLDGMPIQSNAWEVLELSPSGILSATGTTFTMGRCGDGVVAFTADGKVAIAAQDDGSLGVVRFDDNGQATVVHQAFEGSFFASSVTITEDGQAAWIADSAWAENGGGIYRVAIGCDGTLTDEGMVLASKIATAILLLPQNPNRALVVAREVGSSTLGHDVHLVELAPTPRYLAGADLFADDEHRVTAATLSLDGRYALVADGSAWSGLPHRLGVVEIVGDTLRPAQTISPLRYANPSGLAFSPYGNSVLLLTAEALNDALTVFSYDSTNSVRPFTYAGEMSYLGGGPQLPAAAVVIERGGLMGRTLIAEVVGLRQVQFLPGGSVADGSFYSTGSGYAAIVGAVGVQP